MIFAVPNGGVGASFAFVRLWIDSARQLQAHAVEYASISMLLDRHFGKLSYEGFFTWSFPSWANEE